MKYKALETGKFTFLKNSCRVVKLTRQKVLLAKVLKNSGMNPEAIKIGSYFYLF